MNLQRLLQHCFLLFALVSILACAIFGQPALSPPEGSSGDKVPLYQNLQKLEVQEADKTAFVSDILGPQLLLYSSSTDVSWTEDVGAKVQEQLDQSLPDENWRIESEWSGMNQFQVSKWRNGDLNLVVLYLDNLNSEQINDFKRRYGISDLKTGSTLVVTHLWDTTQPIPTATPTETLTPLPTSSPMPTSTPEPSPTATFTPGPTSTPTPRPSGEVPFSSPNDSNALNPVFGWQPGGSEASTYDLSMHPGDLTLIAGPRTDLWESTNTAPLVTYPYAGDFEAQVTVVFTPEGGNWKNAGLGVRSIQNPLNWLRITKGLHQQIDVAGGKGLRLNSTPYSSDTVYFRVKRQGPLFTLSYSTNGSNWIDLQKDYVFEMSDDVEIFLTVYSTNNEGTIAQFSDFSVVIEGHVAIKNRDDVIAVNTTTGAIEQSNDTVSDTIISSTDTPTPSLSCSKEPRGEFRDLWKKHQEQLGCPIQTEPLTFQSAEQPFEDGHMFWVSEIDLVLVTIGHEQGDWILYGDKWDGTDYSCPVQPSAGKFQPVRGFGWVWCREEKIREQLGWGIDEERAIPSGVDLIQGFDNGIIFRDSDGEVHGKVYVMFGKDKGNFIREPY